MLLLLHYNSDVNIALYSFTLTSYFKDSDSTYKTGGYLINALLQNKLPNNSSSYKLKVQHPKRLVAQ